MTTLTKDELLDILAAFRFIQESREWECAWGWNDELYAKIQNIIDPPNTCKLCGALEVHLEKHKLCVHDFHPASLSQWGYTFRQCLKCGEIE